MEDWIKNYFNDLLKLQLNAEVTEKEGVSCLLEQGYSIFIELVKKARNVNGKLMFIGNGGSAGIASHLAIDFSKNGRIPAMAFNDSSALTCLSNDYGFEYVFQKQIEFHARENDLVILISSSGRSKNILNVIESARNIGCSIATFSGFERSNPLRLLGDVNFYVSAGSYGVVEVAHLSIAHSILDYIMEKNEMDTQYSNEQKVAYL